jgi:hypothetical protein
MIDERDADAVRLGQLICHRLSAIDLANRAVAWRECRDRARVIDALVATHVDVGRLLLPE